MITALSLSPAVDKVYFVENFEPGGLYRVREIVKTAGGKGINVARVAALLGEEVAVAGFKAGAAGLWLESEIKKLGVHTELVSIEGESRTNNNIIDRLRGIETEVLEIGPTVTEPDIKRFMDVFQREASSSKVLVCSGGLPEGLPADFYRKLIEHVRPYGIKVILDSSQEMLAEGIKAQPFMVKPNLRELRAFAGRQLQGINDVIEACRNILDEGVEMVVASMGRDGAVMVTAHDELLAIAPEVKAVNTIGSGDSMVAGLAAGLSRGYSTEDILRLGVACGTVNALFEGIGYIEKDLVEGFFKKIEIKRMGR